MNKGLLITCTIPWCFFYRSLFPCSIRWTIADIKHHMSCSIRGLYHQNINLSGPNLAPPHTYAPAGNPPSRISKNNRMAGTGSTQMQNIPKLSYKSLTNPYSAAAYAHFYLPCNSYLLACGMCLIIPCLHLYFSFIIPLLIQIT